jgi:hypothetical protein
MVALMSGKEKGKGLVQRLTGGHEDLAWTRCNGGVLLL